MRSSLLCLVAIVLFIPTASAQFSAADTESVDAIITTLYGVISGPAGEERDWDRFRNLFAPGAQLIPMRVTPDTSHAVFHSADGYIEVANPYLVQNGFYEKEIFRKTERFGPILHAFSTYESYHKADDEKPFARGINSIQLMYDGDRWWVVNVFWDSERPHQPIPATYLP